MSNMDTVLFLSVLTGQSSKKIVRLQVCLFLLDFFCFVKTILIFFLLFLYVTVVCWRIHQA